LNNLPQKTNKKTGKKIEKELTFGSCKQINGECGGLYKQLQLNQRKGQKKGRERAGGRATPQQLVIYTLIHG
jgi:hypothetical protein